MVKMDSFRSTTRSLFVSFLVLIAGVVAVYMYISKIGLIQQHKETGIDALAREKETGESLSDAEKEQSRRLAMYKAYCEKNPSKMVNPLSSRYGPYNHLFFFENIQTVYCFTPKTGCTTMKLLLYNLEHNTTERLRIGFRKAEWSTNNDKENHASHEHNVQWIHQRSHFKTLEHYSEEEARLRLTTYKKIIVVRDPLERLASAWLDKFVITPERLGQFVWADRIKRVLEKYQNQTQKDKSNKVKEKWTFNDTSQVSFRDFLFAVSRRLDRSQHWSSFNSLCLPCQIDYDFIAHTDTLASDVRLFLKKNNITANEDVLPKPRSRNANDDNVFNFYDQVPIEEILDLQDLFQMDYDMFGYSFEEDLAKILLRKARG